MDISNLTPDQQLQLSQLLGQQSQQSIDASQLASQSLQPAPSGSSDDSGSPDVHPAMHVVAQAIMKKHLGSPSTNLTTVTPQTPGHGLGSFLSKLITGSPIMHDSGSPILATGQIPDQSNIPNGMQLQPIGTDADGKPLYDYSAMQKQQSQEGQVAAAMAKMGASNPSLTTVDQIKTASGGRLNDNDAQQLLQAFGGSVPSKMLGTNLNGQRLDSMDALAQARQAMVQQSALKTLLQYGGPGAAQKAASDAVQRSSSLQRAQAIIDQINSSGGMADQRQRSDLAVALGKSINPSGVLTNEAMNQFLPDSYKSKFGNFMEMLTNERQPVNFSGFLPQFQDMLTREMDVNSSVLNQSRQMGMAALQQLPGVSRNTVQQVMNAPAPGMAPQQSQGGAPMQHPGMSNPGQKPDPATRFNQLMAPGNLSKKQVYAIMHQEGY